MEEPVTIVDREVLKVLSVDTRMDILKELSEGSRTPSDLSKKLKKSDSTIVEHLDTLVKAGLVKKIEQPGKKWIFYTLTDRGDGIISSKSRRLVIILITSLVSIVGGFVSLSLYSTQRVIIASKALGEMAQAPANTLSSTVSYYPYISLALFVIGITGITFYYIKSKNRGVLQ